MLTCPTHCPVTGVYLKRFIPCLIVGFIYIYAYDFVLHVGILMDTYKATPQLWRSPADMQSKFTFLLASQAFMAFITLLIFTRNYEGKRLPEGLRFGVLIGLLMGAMSAQSYLWLPISDKLAVLWFAGGLVKGIGLGLVYALVYRDCKTKA